MYLAYLPTGKVGPLPLWSLVAIGDFGMWAMVFLLHVPIFLAVDLIVYTCT